MRFDEACRRITSSNRSLLRSSARLKRSFLREWMSFKNDSQTLRPASSGLLRGFRGRRPHKAAEELFITQSAVSRQIKALEDHLGLKLFERRPRSLQLTESGQALYRIATDVLDRLQAATDRLRVETRTRQLSTLLAPAALGLLSAIPVAVVMLGTVGAAGTVPPASLAGMAAIPGIRGSAAIPNPAAISCPTAVEPRPCNVRIECAGRLIQRQMTSSSTGSLDPAAFFNT